MNHYINELPDLDFDYASNTYPDIGTKLSRDDGKIHPVAHSLIDINFHPTKESCNRLGIPHIDLLSNHYLNDIDLKTIPALHKLEPLVSYAVKSPNDYYHIHNWGSYLKEYDPKTIEDLAKFIGLIRPKVRQLFLNTGNSLTFNTQRMNEVLDDGIICFQEDMLRLISELYSIPLDRAEHLRKTSNFDEYESIDKDDEDVLVSLHKVINKHLMAKGHCLQVVYIILSQCYTKLNRS